MNHSCITPNCATKIVKVRLEKSNENGLISTQCTHFFLSGLKSDSKPFKINGKLRMYLYALEEIEADTELIFNYGDNSASSLQANPWLAL